MSAVSFITSLARKLLARESKGITTIPNRMSVESKAGEIAATLQDAGLPLNRADDFIKSEQDLVRILNLIESTPPVMREVPSGIRSTKSAKIMDMEGKEIDPRSKIMGGKQSETEAEIAARLNQENRKTVSKIKDRQRMVDDAIDNASPGFSGDTKIDAELVAEDLAERMGLVYDDLPTKQRLDLYDQAYTGLSKQRFKGMKKPKDDPEDMAQGGRAGFKDGMSRRKFLQIMGGLAALPVVGKFFKVGKVASKAAPIVKTAPVAGKPAWFDSLVNKVITEGEDVTKQLATKEREIVHTVKLTDEPKSGYVSAQNDQVTVYRDLDDGTVRVEYNSVDNMSEAPVNLTFKPGMADEATKGKPADTFQADEIVPESRMVGPDDFEIEEAVDEFDNVVDLNSDVSKLKEFAGEKLTTKEIVEGINKRKRSKAITEDRGEAADFMTSRQGDYDPSPDDFASGGIARMLGE